MRKRTRGFITFLRHFARHTLIVREILVGLLLLICLGGIAISYAESRSMEESLYFAFITGLSIGYGDITPSTIWGRVISVTIGLVGMVFIGLTVAVATRALSDTVEQLRRRDR